MQESIESRFINQFVLDFGIPRNHVIEVGLGHPHTKKYVCQSYFIKIGERSVIEGELRNYKYLARYDCRDTPDISKAYFSRKFGCMVMENISVFPYLRPPNRLDILFSDLYTVNRFQTHLIDSIEMLQKLHRLEMRKMRVSFPKLTQRAEVKDIYEIRSRYEERYSSYSNHTLCGIIHGDFHLKNIFAISSSVPKFIDLEKMRFDSILIDYAQLELSIFKHVFSQEVEDNLRCFDFLDLYNHKLLFDCEPKLNSPLLQLVYAIRLMLIKYLEREKMKIPLDELDFLYRGYLSYFLADFYLKFGNSSRNRLFSLQVFLALNSELDARVCQLT